MQTGGGGNRVNIAVTGGFGSGKSTAGRILAVAMAAQYVDTDQLCRQQMQPGNPGFEKFRQVFGTQYLNVDGTLNRLLLRQAVYADSVVKTKLEMILHPLVRLQISEDYAHCCEVERDLVVEVPLLFEVGWQNDFAVWVVVYVPEDLCVKRVSSRDGMTMEEIQRVFASQLSVAEKLAAAHFVIDNSGTFVSTVQQIAWLGKKLQGREKMF